MNEKIKKLATQGDAQAQHDLALMYYQGTGVDENNDEAFKWFAKAAEQGHAEAQLQLDKIANTTLTNKSTDTGFNSIIQLYASNYLENQESWYKEYKNRSELPKNDDGNWKSNWHYEFDTCLVGDGNFSYLVLKKNGDLIRLHPFFLASDESVNFNSEHNSITIGSVVDELTSVACIEGMDDYSYPVFDQDDIFGFLGELEPYIRVSVDLHEKTYEAFRDDFDELGLDDDEYYALGQQLLLSCGNTAMDIMDVAEDYNINFNDYKISDLSDYGWAEILGLTPSSDEFKYIAQQNSSQIADILNTIECDKDGGNNE